MFCVIIYIIVGVEDCVSYIEWNYDELKMICFMFQLDLLDQHELMPFQQFVSLSIWKHDFETVINWTLLCFIFTIEGDVWVKCRNWVIINWNYCASCLVFAKFSMSLFDLTLYGRHYCITWFVMMCFMHRFESFTVENGVFNAMNLIFSLFSCDALCHHLLQTMHFMCWIEILSAEDDLLKVMN